MVEFLSGMKCFVHDPEVIGSNPCWIEFSDIKSCLPTLDVNKDIFSYLFIHLFLFLFYFVYIFFFVCMCVWGGGGVMGGGGEREVKIS